MQETPDERPRARKRASRSWCVPPAILHDEGETLESSHILEEHGDALAILLWRCLRSVTLWASAEPEVRGSLFAPDAGKKLLTDLQTTRVDAALEVWLSTILQVVESPDTVTAEIVALVADQVSRWAEARRAYGTAVAFAQGGALVTPERAAAAFRVGALVLRWGRLTRAETWLRRAIGLSRRERDWFTYAQAHVEMGHLYSRRELPQVAERYYKQGLRAGRRHALVTIRGPALHGLFNLAMAAENFEAADTFARSAKRAYGRGHPELPRLVHDIAYLWVLREHFEPAVAMLQKLLVTRTDPAEHALTSSILARAAAGAGARRIYEEAWSRAWGLINRPRTDVSHAHVAASHALTARTLVELARAGARAADWPRMAQAVRLFSTLPPARHNHSAANSMAELAELAPTRFRRR